MAHKKEKDKPLEFHPVANIFPLMEGQEFEDLCEDIEANGLREPICLHPDGRIIDGRNRYRGCVAVGVEPESYEWSEEEYGPLVAFVLSLNLHRRHLTESQRAMVAAEIANLDKGRPTTDQENAQICAFSEDAETPPITQAEAAEMLNISRRTVQVAKQVKDKGAPELVESVRRGQVSVSAAAEVAKLPQQEQQVIVARGKEEIKKKAREIRAQEAQDRKQQKIEQLKDPGAFPDGRYRVIYADPPWKYGDTREKLSSATGAEHHYPTMSLKEICALPVRDLATKDAVLFLWATSPLLEETFQVINAWGFKYKSSFVWDKVRHNLGHYNSVRHEFLLVCTRGSCTPDEKKLFDSVVEIERSDTHSEKPERFREIIDTLYPHGPRIELFRRGEVPEGWSTWGNEAEVSHG